MEKRNSKKDQKNKETLVLVLLVPILLFVTVFSYKILVSLSKDKPRVCSFLGRVWLEGVPSDPSIRRGCFTYQELYSGD